MTEHDLREIETALAIRLPAAYRTTMLAFPLPAFAGNSETELWDDAARLIEVNQQLRAGEYCCVKAWPPHLFCLGIEGDGSASALDLRDPEGAVYWIDHCHADDFEDAEPDNFFEWLSEYTAEYHVILFESGIDPNGTPQERERIEEESARGGCLWLMITPVLIVLGIFAVNVAFRLAVRFVRRLWD
jgi:hypothetical protein